jgi:Ca-activated chloride channel family protein
VVHGKTAEGAWEQRIDAEPVALGEGDPAVVSLYGREAVEDLEMRIAAGLADAEAEATIERLGLEFQIATRLTSWVAVSEEPTVDPTQPLRRERIPQALPYGMSAEGLGLRSATAPAMVSPALACLQVSMTAFVAEASGSVSGRLRSMASDVRKSVARQLGRLELGESLGVTPSPPAPAPPVARLVRRAGHELHFEITLDHPLDWAPRSVDVIWPDGTRMTATVIEKHTTRSGKYQTSQVLRLSVRLGAEPPSSEAPLRLEISSGTAVTVIPVQT